MSLLPSRSLPLFNDAVGVHATMAGLMKDVGASYGCHNSADGVRISPRDHLSLPSPPFTYACMTSDSQPPVGGSVGVRKMEKNRGWAQRQGGPSPIHERAKLLIAYTPLNDEKWRGYIVPASIVIGSRSFASPHLYFVFNPTKSLLFSGVLRR